MYNAFRLLGGQVPALSAASTPPVPPAADASESSPDGSIPTGASDMDVPNWPPARVDQWLQDNRLHNHRNAFHEQQVDGNQLLHITQGVLLERFRVTSLAERARVMIAIRQLKADYNKFLKRVAKAQYNSQAPVFTPSPDPSPAAHPAAAYNPAAGVVAYQGAGVTPHPSQQPVQYAYAYHPQQQSAAIYAHPHPQYVQPPPPPPQAQQYPYVQPHHHLAAHIPTQHPSQQPALLHAHPHHHHHQQQQQQQQVYAQFPSPAQAPPRNASFQQYPHQQPIGASVPVTYPYSGSPQPAVPTAIPSSSHSVRYGTMGNQPASASPGSSSQSSRSGGASASSTRSAPARLHSKAVFLPRTDSLTYQANSPSPPQLLRTLPGVTSAAAAAAAAANQRRPSPSPSRTPHPHGASPLQAPATAAVAAEEHSHESPVILPRITTQSPSLRGNSPASATHSPTSDDPLDQYLRQLHNLQHNRSSPTTSLPSPTSTLADGAATPKPSTPLASSTNSLVPPAGTATTTSNVPLARTSILSSSSGSTVRNRNRDSAVSIAARPRAEAIAENLDIFFPQANPDMLRETLGRGLTIPMPRPKGMTMGSGAAGARQPSIRVPPRTAASASGSAAGSPLPAAIPPVASAGAGAGLVRSASTSGSAASGGSGSLGSPNGSVAPSDTDIMFSALQARSTYLTKLKKSGSGSGGSGRSRGKTSGDLANEFADLSLSAADTPDARAGTRTPRPLPPAINTTDLPRGPYPVSSGGGASSSSASTDEMPATVTAANATAAAAAASSFKASTTATTSGGGSLPEVMESTMTDSDGAPLQWIKGELIGLGSFGRVYLGLAVATGSMMAVKQVEMPKAQGPGGAVLGKKNAAMLEALQREIELLRDLSHENIVHYLGFERARDTLNVFLEYVPGGSLASLLGTIGTALPDGLTAMFTRQIVVGVEYLHSQGILHRDLKCANVLVDDEGVCKISDFGLSKRMGLEPASSSSDGDIDSAQSNPLKGAYDFHSQHSMQGSVYWMAPEVVRGRGYSAKVDIWSLGCIVVEMVTGNRPWVGFNEIAAMYHIGSAKKPQIPEGVAREAREFCDVCFEVDPDLRPTAAQLERMPFVVNADPNWDYRGFIAQYIQDE